MNSRIELWVAQQKNRQLGNGLRWLIAVFVSGPIAFNYIFDYIGYSFTLAYWQGVVVSLFFGLPATWIAIALWLFKLWGFEV